jgi:hypothetical protein
MDTHANKLRQWTTRQAETMDDQTSRDNGRPCRHTETMDAHAGKLRQWTPMKTI